MSKKRIGRRDVKTRDLIKRSEYVQKEAAQLREQLVADDEIHQAIRNKNKEVIESAAALSNTLKRRSRQTPRDKQRTKP